MLDLDERLRRGPLRVQSIWSVEQTRSLGREVLSRRRKRFLTRVALGAVCAGALLIGVTRFHRASENAAHLPPTAANATNGVHYTDGSVAEITTPGSVVHLDQQTPDFVSSTLVSGRARFDVVHNPARTFEVHAGDVSVRVLGTAFVVERAGSGAHVSVERGRVRVSWLGGEVLLGVGEAGDYPPPQAAPAPAPEESAVPVEALNLEPPSAEPPSAEPHVWRDYAHRGEYAKAFAALRRTPNDVREEPADLLLAADVARLSSHPAQAVAPLRRVCERYSKDSHAPVAAFTLGRVLLDDLGRAGEAASAFELAARLWPSGPLASDAMAREAEAWKRAGQLPEAQAVARKYLAQHPGGRHAASLRAMLDAE